MLGAGGFLGANLAARLLRDGRHSLTALDVAKPGELGNAKPGHLEYIQMDVLEETARLRQLIRAHDVVVDLVRLVNPSLHLSHPLDVFRLNFSPGLRIAEICAEEGRRLVHFSTAEVFGLSPAQAIGRDAAIFALYLTEDDSPMILGPTSHPRWMFACARQLLERAIHALGLERGLDFTILRPFNVLGPQIDRLPGEQSGYPRVFAHFMNALLYGTEMKLVDGGEAFRAYVYVDDAIECAVRVLEHPEPCRRQILHIGAPGNEVTIRELARRMLAIYRARFSRPDDILPRMVTVSAEEFYGRPFRDSDRRVPDISKARRLLGWEPTHDLNSLLELTMAYFVERRDARRAAR